MSILTKEKVYELLEDECLHYLIDSWNSNKVMISEANKRAICNTIVDYRRKEKDKHNAGPLKEIDFIEIANVIHELCSAISINYMYEPRNNGATSPTGVLFTRNKNQLAVLRKRKSENNPTSSQSPPNKVFCEETLHFMKQLQNISSKHLPDDEDVKFMLKKTHQFRQDKINTMANLKNYELLAMAKEITLPVFYLDRKYVSFINTFLYIFKV